MSSTANYNDTRILPHHTYLVLGYALMVAAAGVRLVHILVHPHPLLEGLFDILRIAVIVAGVGYFAHRLGLRMERLERRNSIPAQRTPAGSVYVARAAVKPVRVTRAPIDADTVVLEAEPATAEAAEWRRLVEAHLREQFAAELESKVVAIGKAKYAEGYADGITRRGEGERD